MLQAAQKAYHEAIDPGKQTFMVSVHPPLMGFVGGGGHGACLLVVGRDRSGGVEDAELLSFL